MGEDLENVIKKEEVAKVIFKSGREQVFSGVSTATAASVTRDEEYEYPPMEENVGAVLPFDFIFEGEPSPEEGIQAQEYYYSELMRKPERNTIDYQDLEDYGQTTTRCRDYGISRLVGLRYGGDR